MLLRTTFAAFVALALAPAGARAAESYDNCTGFIDSIPATVTTAGVWCLRHDLASSMSTGTAIFVDGSHITIDCNGFRVETNAGPANTAWGVNSYGRLNVSVRNCNVRGFMYGIDLQTNATAGNFVVENNVLYGSTHDAISLRGGNSVVRGNTILRTGGSTNGASVMEHASITTYGTTDILDNIIAGVTGSAMQWGIESSNNVGGSISGNRIRDIASTGGKETMGIRVMQGSRLTLRDNDVSSVGGAQGLLCVGTTTARARGNIVSGFQTGVSGCADAGSNDSTP